MFKNKKNTKKGVEIQNSSFDKAKIAWTTPDYVRYERGIVWKILVAVMLTSAIISTVLYGAWTFAMVIIAFVSVYYLAHRHEPQDMSVLISEAGIKIANRRYPYSQIEGFWIIYEPSYFKKLVIRVKKDILVDIPVYLVDQDAHEIDEFLVKKIPHIKGKNEAFMDALLRLLKI